MPWSRRRGPGWELDRHPCVCGALSVCSVTQPPRPPPRPWPQASSVSAPTSWALSSPHAPALWSLCPCLGSRAGGTEAGQGLSPVTHMGPGGGGRMIQAWPLPLALPLFTQMQGPATAQGQRLPARSSPEPCLPSSPDSPACPQLLSPSLHPLPPPLPSCGTSGKFYPFWASVFSFGKWASNSTSV